MSGDDERINGGAFRRPAKSLEWGRRRLDFPLTAWSPDRDHRGGPKEPNGSGRRSIEERGRASGAQ